MEKAKSKKKLIAIIAGAAMAFVLTVVVSVAATLAYFGDTATGTGSTIKMGQALEFDGDLTSTATSGVTLTDVLPGWSGSVDVKGTVATTNTAYYLRLKLTSEAAVDNTNEDVEPTDIIAMTGVKYGDATLTAHTDGYYYLVTGSNVTRLTAGDDYTFVVSFKVDESVKNVAALASITLTAQMEIVQADYLVEGDSAALADVASAWATASGDNYIG